MLCNASLYREDNGSIGGVVVVGRDITRHYPDRIEAKNQWRWRSLATLPALAMALAVLLLLTNTVASRVDSWTKARIVDPVSVSNPPYIHTGDHQPASIFHPGQTAFLHVSTRRSASCFSLIRQRIVSLNPGDSLQRTVWSNLPDSFGYTDPGDFEIDYRFIVPADLPPGNYALERDKTFTCGSTTVTTNDPLLPLSVVK